MHPALRVVFRHGEIQLDRGAAAGFVQSDVRRNLVILSGPLETTTRLPRVPPAARETGEQIRQVDVVKRELRIPELPAPVRRRLKLLPGLMPPQLVVGGALFRILEGLIGVGDLLKSFLADWILGHVRVILVRQFAVGLLDRIGVGIARYTEDLVVVLLFHLSLLKREPRIPAIAQEAHAPPAVRRVW